MKQTLAVTVERDEKNCLVAVKVLFVRESICLCHKDLVCREDFVCAVNILFVP